jgi:DNA-directed RNA polymerase alpha subunit
VLFCINKEDIIAMINEGNIEDAIAEVYKIGFLDGINSCLESARDLLKSNPLSGTPSKHISLNSSIKRLNLSTRSHNALINKDIRTIADLTILTLYDLQHIRCIGTRSINEITSKLAAAGYRLQD